MVILILRKVNNPLEFFKVMLFFGRFLKNKLFLEIIRTINILYILDMTNLFFIAISYFSFECKYYKQFNQEEETIIKR